MLILNLGVPRSGTVLVFNIIRAILNDRGVKYEILNANERESEQYFSRERDFTSHNLLMHSHSMGPLMSEAIRTGEGVVAFYNYRDPRDVLVSLMRLHDHSFKEALAMTEAAFSYLRRALRLQRVMLIPYRHLTQAPSAFVFMIGQHLGTVLDFPTVERISEDTGIERHRQVMEQVRASAPSMPGIRVWKNRHRKLKENVDSLINDRHIQSGRVGRWRNELTPAQQRSANERFSSVISRLGFEPQ